MALGAFGIASNFAGGMADSMQEGEKLRLQQLQSDREDQEQKNKNQQQANTNEQFGWSRTENQRHNKMMDELNVPEYSAPAGATVLPTDPSAPAAGAAPAYNPGLDRSRFADELTAKPWLKNHIMAVSAGENNDPTANLAVFESMMNRADLMGTSLEQESRRYNPSAGTGYYAGFNPSALNNPNTRAMIETNLGHALSGSNVSNYATDNSSEGNNQFTTRRYASGMYAPTLPTSLNGEYFSRPNNSTARGYDRYDAWLAAKQAAAKSTGAESAVAPSVKTATADTGTATDAALPTAPTASDGGPKFISPAGAPVSPDGTPATALPKMPDRLMSAASGATAEVTPAPAPAPGATPVKYVKAVGPDGSVGYVDASKAQPRSAADIVRHRADILMKYDPVAGAKLMESAQKLSSDQIDLTAKQYGASVSAASQVAQVDPNKGLAMLTQAYSQNHPDMVTPTFQIDKDGTIRAAYSVNTAAGPVVTRSETFPPKDGKPDLDTIFRKAGSLASPEAMRQRTLDDSKMATEFMTQQVEKARVDAFAAETKNHQWASTQYGAAPPDAASYKTKLQQQQAQENFKGANEEIAKHQNTFGVETDPQKLSDYTSEVFRRWGVPVAGHISSDGKISPPASGAGGALPGPTTAPVPNPYAASPSPAAAPAPAALPAPRDNTASGLMQTMRGLPGRMQDHQQAAAQDAAVKEAQKAAKTALESPDVSATQHRVWSDLSAGRAPGLSDVRTLHGIVTHYPGAVGLMNRDVLEYIRKFPG